MTRASEQTALGQGLALGAIMLGVENVMSSKLTLELSFRRAWRIWPTSRLFKSINAGPRADDIVHVLHASGRKPRNKFAFWESEWPFVPVQEFDDWTSDEVAECIDGSVSAADWSSLVDLWVDGMSLKS
jgi:hypothetical protein